MSENNDLLWMHGLEEYFDIIGEDEHRETFHTIKRAVMYGDPHAVRDLMTREVFRGHTELTDQFTSLIFNKLLGDTEVTSRPLLQYISHSIDDDFIKRISAWSIKWGQQANLNDHFSRGQIKSKFWLISELNKFVASPKEIAIYGGWYATIAYFLFLNFDTLTKVRSLDLDNKAIGIADDFNYPETYDSWKFKATNQDVTKIEWWPSGFKTSIRVPRSTETVRDSINPDIIINTSCEHMNEDWFYNIPTGRPEPVLVALQTNDYFDNPQHSNCVHNVEEALEKYKFSRVLYAGTLKTDLYNRFMIIGFR